MTKHAHDDTVSSVRWENLVALRRDFQEQQEKAFPDEAPMRGLDQEFSVRLGLHKKYYGHIKAGRRNIGNPLARAAELAFGKPIGWMDVKHIESQATEGEEHASLRAFLALYKDDPQRTRTWLMREFQDRFTGKRLP